MADQYFHLTIGPVQAFVAQARRTRDFWAGSFILSYLSSVAMIAVRQQQGKIEFPVPDENFLHWLESGEGKSQASETPKQGSVPNRFKAMDVRVGVDFDPQLVVTAVQSAWQELAELVWQQDLALIADMKSEQRQIWDRQINRFWDISWCLTSDSNASNLLDRRKNWRNHVIADEPGVKCSLMEGYQELSGAVRVGNPLRQFWSLLRAQSENIARDIRVDEYLCAIAFVKRRFVYVFEHLKYVLPTSPQTQAKIAHGWKLSASVPSIAYMASTPWLAASIYSSVNNQKASEAIEALEESLGKLNTPWEGKVSAFVATACEQNGQRVRRWRQVDGQYLFLPAVDQMLKEAKKEALRENEFNLLKELKINLSQVYRATGLGEPSPFYAILLMDGDSLGVQMSNPAKQQGISLGLNRFTAAVPGIVEQHSGFLVYAGGDDVLAILPQPFAIACSVAIQTYYDQCFTEINKTQGVEQITTSISGAINFAHYKTPLTHILQDAHQLLDEVAKEQAGRNSLAIRVHKPGGLNAQWSKPWPYVSALQRISQQVANHLQGDLSRSFFFKLEDLITNLGLSHQEHGLSESVIHSLVRAAWTFTGNKLEELPESMEINLLEACRVVTRSLVENRESYDESLLFSAGALRLIQFLATENQSFLRLCAPGDEA